MKILIFILTLSGSSIVWAECVNGDCWNGNGTFFYPYGQTYVGEFVDGERTIGTSTFKSGHKYSGEWRDHYFHGKGTWTEPNGDEYVGEWRDGRRNGEGTQTYADGRVKVGVWENDQYFGTKAEWGSKEKHDRIYRACLLDKDANHDMQVPELKQAVVETCAAIAADPTWYQEWKYD